MSKPTRFPFRLVIGIAVSLGLLIFLADRLLTAFGSSPKDWSAFANADTIILKADDRLTNSSESGMQEVRHVASASSRKRLAELLANYQGERNYMTSRSMPAVLLAKSQGATSDIVFFDPVTRDLSWDSEQRQYTARLTPSDCEALLQLLDFPLEKAR